MLIPNQYILVKWNPNNKSYYESLNYRFTKFGEQFKVKAEDLPHSSHLKVKVTCDYCGKELEITMQNYTRTINGNGKVACKSCAGIKKKETMISKYGVEFPIQNPDIKKKIESTNISRYGTKNPLSNKQVQEKVKETLIERYGVDSPYKSKEIKDKANQTIKERYGFECCLQSPEIREKSKETLFKKYGVSNIMELQEFRDKAKETCLEKYGGESSQSSLEIRKKSMQTLLEKNSVPSSKAEQAMSKRIEEIYGADNCQEQYPVDRVFLDCLLQYQGLKIDVEFDGDFWHKDKESYDNRRDYFLKRKGYKIIRFRSKGKIPTEEQIKQCVNYLVNNNHWRIKINI